jgi:hypothetical protein
MLNDPTKINPDALRATFPMTPKSMGNGPLHSGRFRKAGSKGWPFAL